MSLIHFEKMSFQYFLYLAVTWSNVNLGSSFEQTWQSLSARCYIPRFNFKAFLVLKKKTLKCFLLYMGLAAILLFNRPWPFVKNGRGLITIAHSEPSAQVS